LGLASKRVSIAANTKAAFFAAENIKNFFNTKYETKLQKISFGIIKK